MRKLLSARGAPADGIPAYPAKLEGTSGHIILEPRNDGLVAPQITFVPLSGTHETFVFAIDDIVEIKKVRVAAFLASRYVWVKLTWVGV